MSHKQEYFGLHVDYLFNIWLKLGVAPDPGGPDPEILSDHAEVLEPGFGREPLVPAE